MRTTGNQNEPTAPAPLLLPAPPPGQRRTDALSDRFEATALSDLRSALSQAPWSTYSTG